jgi:hypothetical protein
VNYDYMMDSERQVAEFLDALGLAWIYQSPVHLHDERKSPAVWTPDFYIPKLGIYVEVGGSKEFNWKYRDKIYRENNISVICLHFSKKEKNWQKSLVKRIREVEEQRHSEAMKQIESLPAEILVY